MTAEPGSEEQSSKVITRFVIISTLVLAGIVVGLLVFDKIVKTEWINAANKGAWDVLDVLLVPLAVGWATVIFTGEQNRRQRKADDAQKKIALDAEERRAQDEALQAYLDKMSELLIDQKLHDKRNEYDAERVTARARSLAVLRRLDPVRKRTVLLFLREARLINRNVTHYEARYVGLDDADLSEANLRGARLVSTSGKEFISLKNANLRRAKLSKTILYGADLSGADLSEANLRHAYLSKTTLSGSILREANLSKANLSGSILREANLSGADLLGANLSGSDLREVNLIRANLLEANLSEADLSKATLIRPNLIRANLTGSNLIKANLTGAYLSGADLSDADLSDADLSDARGWTIEQLTAARSLEGATMPYGQTL
jgi:uncharacterized protein YjbI with pentapeptide repeats